MRGAPAGGACGGRQPGALALRENEIAGMGCCARFGGDLEPRIRCSEALDTFSHNLGPPAFDLGSRDLLEFGTERSW